MHPNPGFPLDGSLSRLGRGSGRNSPKTARQLGLLQAFRTDPTGHDEESRLRHRPRREVAPRLHPGNHAQWPRVRLIVRSHGRVHRQLLAFLLLGTAQPARPLARWSRNMGGRPIFRRPHGPRVQDVHRQESEETIFRLLANGCYPQAS